MFADLVWHYWLAVALVIPAFLLVIMTIVAVQCGVCFPMLREWQRYKEEHQFDELIELITNNVHGTTGWPQESSDQATVDTDPKSR